MNIVIDKWNPVTFTSSSNITAIDIRLSQPSDYSFNRNGIAYGLHSDMTNVQVQSAEVGSEGFKYSGIFMGNVGIGILPHQKSSVPAGHQLLAVNGRMTASNFQITDGMIVTSLNIYNAFMNNVQGHFGIGTSSPEQRLSVMGDMTATTLKTGGFISPSLEIKNQPFIIDNGRVGVGTLSPSTQLELYKQFIARPDNDFKMQLISINLDQDYTVQKDITGLDISISSAQNNQLGLEEAFQATPLHIDVSGLPVEADGRFIGLNIVSSHNLTDTNGVNNGFAYNEATANAAIFMGGPVGIQTTDPAAPYLLDLNGILRATSISPAIFTTIQNISSFNNLIATSATIEQATIYDLEVAELIQQSISVTETLDLPTLTHIVGGLALISSSVTVNGSVHVTENVLANTLSVSRGLLQNLYTGTPEHLMPVILDLPVSGNALLVSDNMITRRININGTLLYDETVGINATENAYLVNIRDIPKATYSPADNQTWATLRIQNSTANASTVGLYLIPGAVEDISLHQDQNRGVGIAAVATNNMQPFQVTYSGTAQFNGEPLAGAKLMTHPTPVINPGIHMYFEDPSETGINRWKYVIEEPVNTVILGNAQPSEEDLFTNYFDTNPSSLTPMTRDMEDRRVTGSMLTFITTDTEGVSRERVRFTDDGNLAIGTTEANKKLLVNGDARFTTLRSEYAVTVSRVESTQPLLMNVSTLNIIASTNISESLFINNHLGLLTHAPGSPVPTPDTDHGVLYVDNNKLTYALITRETTSSITTGNIAETVSLDSTILPFWDNTGTWNGDAFLYYVTENAILNHHTLRVGTHNIGLDDNTSPGNLASVAIVNTINATVQDVDPIQHISLGFGNTNSDATAVTRNGLYIGLQPGTHTLTESGNPDNFYGLQVNLSDLQEQWQTGTGEQQLGYKYPAIFRGGTVFIGRKNLVTPNALVHIESVSKNYALLLDSADSVTMAISGSGNVRIGTLTGSTTTNLVVKSQSTDPNDPALHLIDSAGNTLFWVQNNGKVGFQTSDTSQLSSAGIRFADPIQVPVLSAGTLNVVLRSDTRFGITNNRLVVPASGGVGIGTESPSGLLHVVQRIDSSITTSQNQYIANILFKDAANTDPNNINREITGIDIDFKSKSDNNVFGALDSTIRTIRGLSIDTSGLVSNTDQDSNAQVTGLYVDVTDTKMQADNNLVVDPSDADFNSYGPTPLQTVTTPWIGYNPAIAARFYGGNVGINTDTPTVPLEVNGALRTRAINFDTVGETLVYSSDASDSADSGTQTLYLGNQRYRGNDGGEYIISENMTTNKFDIVKFSSGSYINPPGWNDPATIDNLDDLDANTCSLPIPNTTTIVSGITLTQLWTDTDGDQQQGCLPIGFDVGSIPEGYVASMNVLLGTFNNVYFETLDIDNALILANVPSVLENRVSGNNLGLIKVAAATSVATMNFLAVNTANVLDEFSAWVKGDQPHSKDVRLWVGGKALISGDATINTLNMGSIPNLTIRGDSETDMVIDSDVLFDESERSVTVNGSLKLVEGVRFGNSAVSDEAANGDNIIPLTTSETDIMVLYRKEISGATSPWDLNIKYVQDGAVKRKTMSKALGSPPSPAPQLTNHSFVFFDETISNAFGSSGLVYTSNIIIIDGQDSVSHNFTMEFGSQSADGQGVELLSTITDAVAGDFTQQDLHMTFGPRSAIPGTPKTFYGLDLDLNGTSKTDNAVGQTFVGLRSDLSKLPHNYYAPNGDKIRAKGYAGLFNGGVVGAGTALPSTNLHIQPIATVNLESSITNRAPTASLIVSANATPYALVVSANTLFVGVNTQNYTGATKTSLGIVGNDDTLSLRVANASDTPLLTVSKNIAIGLNVETPLATLHLKQLDETTPFIKGGDNFIINEDSAMGILSQNRDSDALSAIIHAQHVTLNGTTLTHFRMDFSNDKALFAVTNNRLLMSPSEGESEAALNNDLKNPAETSSHLIVRNAIVSRQSGVTNNALTKLILDYKELTGIHRGAGFAAISSTNAAIALTPIRDNDTDRGKNHAIRWTATENLVFSEQILGTVMTLTGTENTTGSWGSRYWDHPTSSPFNYSWEGYKPFICLT